MYKFIKNPETNRNVNIKSTLGRQILKIYLKYGGATVDLIDDNDFIMKDIQDSKDWKLSHQSECHHSGMGLFPIINQYYHVQSMEGIEWENISEIISDHNNHFILYITCQGHCWFLEIKNGSFRILSLWAGKHGFYEYFKSNKYGKFNGISELNEFFRILTILNGNDIFDKSVIQEFWTNIDEKGRWGQGEEGIKRLKESQAALETIFGERQHTDEMIDTCIKYGDDINSGAYFSQPPTLKIRKSFKLTKK